MALTDANGAVSFEVAPGDYFLDVIPPIGYRDTADIEVLDIKDAEHRQVEFRIDKQAAHLMVSVVDLATGQALSNVEVRLLARVP